MRCRCSWAAFLVAMPVNLSCGRVQQLRATDQAYWQGKPPQLDLAATLLGATDPRIYGAPDAGCSLRSFTMPSRCTSTDWSTTPTSRIRGSARRRWIGIRRMNIEYFVGRLTSQSAASSGVR